MPTFRRLIYVFDSKRDWVEVRRRIRFNRIRLNHHRISLPFRLKLIIVINKTRHLIQLSQIYCKASKNMNKKTLILLIWNWFQIPSKSFSKIYFRNGHDPESTAFTVLWRKAKKRRKNINFGRKWLHHLQSKWVDGSALCAEKPQTNDRQNRQEQCQTRNDSQLSAISTESLLTVPIQEILVLLLDLGPVAQSHVTPIKVHWLLVQEEHDLPTFAFVRAVVFDGGDIRSERTQLARLPPALTHVQVVIGSQSFTIAIGAQCGEEELYSRGMREVGGDFGKLVAI